MYSAISGKFAVMIVYPYEREFRVTRATFSEKVETKVCSVPDELRINGNRPKYLRLERGTIAICKSHFWLKDKLFQGRHLTRNEAR